MPLEACRLAVAEDEDEDGDGHSDEDDEVCDGSEDAEDRREEGADDGGDVWSAACGGCGRGGAARDREDSAGMEGIGVVVAPASSEALWLLVGAGDGTADTPPLGTVTTMSMAGAAAALGTGAVLEAAAAEKGRRGWR